MNVANAFPRDPTDSATDHRSCNDSDHREPESFHPTLPDSASQIRNGNFAAHATDGSRSTSNELFPAPRFLHGSGPARDVSDLSPTHRHATHIQQRDHLWALLPGIPNPVHIQAPFQGNFVASTPFWGIGIPHPPAADDLQSSGFPPIDVELSPSVRPYSSFAPPHLDQVSEETSFPRNDVHLSYYVPPATSTIGRTEGDQVPSQQSSESQVSPLIANEIYNSIALHQTVINSQGGRNSSSPPGLWMTVIPQRSYARKGDRERQESIIFKVNGRIGIRARDAIGRIYGGLEGRDDQVFVDKCSVLMLRIEWPEYLPWSRKIRLNNWKKNPERIKLEKLATEASKCVERFIQDVRSKKHPDAGFTDWRVGAQNIGIDHLVLLALDKASRGSWQPRIGFLSQYKVDSSSTPFES